MHKILFKFGLIGLALFIAPHIAYGAELNFKIIPNDKTNNKEILVEVRINPQSKTLNVVEGEISFGGSSSDNLSVQIENGESILSLWPLPPQYLKDEKIISFAGGVPGGFSNEGLLFYLRLSSTVPEDILLSYKGSAYLNDGLGTKDDIFPGSFMVSKEDFENQNDKTITEDTLPYKPITIVFIIIVGILLVLYSYKRLIKK